MSDDGKPFAREFTTTGRQYFKVGENAVLCLTNTSRVSKAMGPMTLPDAEVFVTCWRGTPEAVMSGNGQELMVWVTDDLTDALKLASGLVFHTAALLHNLFLLATGELP